MFAMIKLGHDRKLGLLKDEMTWAKAKNLLVISISMCASKGLTNMIIFKSLKLLSIMFVGYFVLHNKPNCKETSAACLLATSCVLFTLGDMDISPSFSFFGLVIVLLSLVGDAFHTNFQEKGLKNGVTVSEILMFSNFFAFLQTFVIAVWTREIAVGFEYCSHKPLIYLLITMRSLAIYLGAACFMQLIKDFGSVLAATITTVRKIVSVLLSFAVVAKPFTFKYLYAGVFFVLGLGVDVSRRIK
ncbi:hypothetical protein MHBO_000675 [Bonamia ostreae]|uniref:UDP-galactose transporter n=1 Tax=Bonamia ostreae TaxID=126728 RepID=A0ABV2AGF0_9EUKA